MATATKKKPTSTTTTPPATTTEAAPVNTEANSAASAALRRLYGWGTPKADKAVKAMKPACVSEIVKADSANRRDRIPAIIAKHNPTKR